MRTRILLALTMAAIGLAALLLVSGCGSSSGVAQTGTGRLGILLTDAPSDFEQVLVTVAGVQVHASGGSWITVVDKEAIDAFITQPIDLLSLHNVEKLVGVGAIPAGHYTQFRLLLMPEAEVVLTGGVHKPLRIASGAQTGLKAHGCTVPEGGTAYLLVDINADQIIPPQGAGTDYILPPTAISMTVYPGELGSLQGTVSPAASGAVVTACWQGTNVSVGQATIDGTGVWEIPNLLPADYYLLVSADGYELFDSRATAYAVAAGAETTVPLITLTPTPPSP